MKILISGVTALHKNTGRRRTDYISIPQMLAETLTDMGHEVEHRGVEPGEDLTRFDRAFVFLNNPHSLTGAQPYGCFWAMHQLGENCIIGVDDWQQPLQVPKAYRTISEAGFFDEKCGFFRKFNDDERWHPYREGLRHGFLDWVHHDVLIPAHSWSGADLSKLHYKGSLGYQFFWDPSSCEYSQKFEPQQVLNYATRDRAWIHASLQHHNKGLKALGLDERSSWELLRFGHKYGDSPKAMISERDVASLYGTHTGCVSVGYEHSGSGYWRTRFQLAARAKCIVLADERDADIMSDAYKIRPHEVEGLSNLELQKIADDQRNWFMATAASNGAVKLHLEYILNVHS